MKFKRTRASTDTISLCVARPDIRRDFATSSCGVITIEEIIVNLIVRGQKKERGRFWTVKIVL